MASGKTHVVLVVDGPAGEERHEFDATMADDLAWSTRYPDMKATQPKFMRDAVLMTARKLYVAAQRRGISPAGETLEAFVERLVDYSLEEAPPLTEGRDGRAVGGPDPMVPDSAS